MKPPGVQFSDEERQWPSTSIVIQIPCLNEESSLPQTLKLLAEVEMQEGNIQLLLINDGSTDGTLEVAWISKSHVHDRFR